MLKKFILFLTLLFSFFSIVDIVEADTRSQRIDKARESKNVVKLVAAAKTKSNIFTDNTDFTTDYVKLNVNENKITKPKKSNTEINKINAAKPKWEKFEQEHAPDTSFNFFEDTDLVFVPKKNLSITYKEAITYNNEKIDIKATIIDYKKLDGAKDLEGKINFKDDYIEFDKVSLPSLIKFPKQPSIGIRTLAMDWVEVKYEFFKSGTNTPKKVKGYTTYWDIDGKQGVILKGNYENIYVPKESELYIGNVSGYAYIFDNSDKFNDAMYDIYYSFLETFNSTRITRIYTFGHSSFIPGPNNLPGWAGDGAIIHKNTDGGIVKQKVEKYTCEENTEEYGKCVIKKWERKADQADTSFREIKSNRVDCNSYQQGSAYNGKQLMNASDNSKTGCPQPKKYNYDLDVACENCDGNNTKGSYQIQDVADWEAIVHTKIRTDEPILNKYFLVDKNYLCREEYNIALPNKNTTKYFTLKKGRYITVNEPGGVIQKGVYNLTPIKVTKTRQCIPIDPNGNFANLTRLRVDRNDTQTLESFGRINLKYIEKKYGHTFVGDEALKVDTNRISRFDEKQESVNINSITYPVLIEKQEAYFKLDDDVYRYTKIGTGESSLTKPNNTSQYRDLGVPNLPIAFTNSNNIKIQFGYQLPTQSKMYQYLFSKATKSKGAVITGLTKNATVDRIYKRDSDLDKTVAKSACYNLYKNTSTDKYKKCVENRKGDNYIDILTNCRTSLLGFEGKGEVFVDGNAYVYSCPFWSDGSSDDNCKNETDAKRYGVDWNSKKSKCCPIGTKYDSSTGECRPCETESDAKELELDWNPNDGGYCCPIGTKYNKITKKCEPDTSKNNCKTETDAKRYGVDWNPTTSECCPEGTKYDETTKKCKPITSGSCKKEGDKCYDSTGLETPCDGEHFKKSCTCKQEGDHWLGPNAEIITTSQVFNQKCPCTTERNQEILDGLKIKECPDIGYNNPVDDNSTCYHRRCPNDECPTSPDGETCPDGNSGANNNMIYRTIDLNNPFPGQDGKENGRNTGSNWCTRNINGVILSCDGKPDKAAVEKGNNSLVYNQIINNRGTKGMTVYTKEPLYTISLDSKAIKAIKDINKTVDSKSYEDWNYIQLDIVNNVYYSTFLKNQFSGKKVTGKCMVTNSSSGNNSIKTKCAEDKS